LIGKAVRSGSGYRHYAEADIHTLRFIRRARDLGFTVEQIGELLALWRDRNRASKEVKKLALAHVATLETKAAQLRAMSRTLRHLATTCHGDGRPACPILEDLAESSPAASTAVKQARPGAGGHRAGERRGELRRGNGR